jgi:hypothetical protein
MCLERGVVRIGLYTLWVAVERLHKRDKDKRYPASLFRGQAYDSSNATLCLRFLSLPLSLTALSLLSSRILKTNTTVLNFVYVSVYKDQYLYS